MYHRNRALIINLYVLNKLELDRLVLNQIYIVVIPDIFGMIMMRSLIISYKNGVLTRLVLIKMNLY